MFVLAKSAQTFMKQAFFGLVLLITVFFFDFSVFAQKFFIPEINKNEKNNKQEKAPVKFGQVTAFSEGKGVLLEWQTEFESNNLGFVIYRLKGSRRIQVNRGLVSSSYLETGFTRSIRKKYSFFDADGSVKSSYYIESLNLNGKKQLSKKISARYAGFLSELTGVSSESLHSAARTAEPTTLINENLLPADLQNEVILNVTPANAERQLWVASQPGVKIGVRKEGIYRVTRAELQAAGFQVNAPTSYWQLYANGNEQAINIGGDGDYIEFYGRGIDTVDSDTQIYFLIVGNSNGKRINNTVRRQFGARILAKNYAQTFFRKDRFIYSSNILNGEAENFFGSIINNSGTTSISVSLTGVDFTSPNTTIEIGLQGFTGAPNQTKVSLNGRELCIINGTDRNLSIKSFNIPTLYLSEGSNNLQLIAMLGSSDVSVFDSVKVSYARKYLAQQNRLSFYSQNYRASFLENFTSPNIRVFDLTYPDSPLLITGLPIEQTTGGTYRVVLPSGRGRIMYAVENSAILSANSITQNQPSTLATTNHIANLIIITYKDWAAQANDWAEYRRAQGMTVEVVNVEDVYDEFNFGIVSAPAIRNFLKFAADNWQSAPNYVLLIGDATYDPRNYTGNGNNSFIPTKLVDTVYTETGSDDWLTDFNGDGLTEIPIGRLPVRNGQTVTQLLGKVSAFEQNISQSNLSRGVIFASDLPNGYDFEGMSNRLRQQLPQNVNSFMINRGSSNARSSLLNEINNGRFLVNYSGHGTTADWVDSSFFSKPDANGLTNTNLSIFTMLTCLNGYFINPSSTAASDGLGEVILKAQNGGVASWASTGLTTPDVQEIMAVRFFNQIGAGNFMRLGDLIKDSKNAVDSGRDVRLSWVLLGDPTLKVK